MAIALKDRLARQASGNAVLNFDPTGRDEPQLVSIPLSLIDPDPHQPRKDLGDLTELALSIREHGLLQPIIVEAVDGGRYRILAGERRFAACRTLNSESVSCIVRTVEEQSRLALQLIENLHRKDLHPLEEARAFKRLQDEFNLDQSALAKRLGMAPSSMNETLRILQLSPDLLAEVQTSEHINKSVLLEIAKVSDPEQQRTLWQQAQAGNMTTRQVRAAKQQGKPVKRRNAPVTIALDTATVTIRFKQGEATITRVVAALEQALASERTRS